MEATGETHGGLPQRALAMLLSPYEEWQAIARESRSARSILLGYVIPLAVLGPIAGFLGNLLFGADQLSSFEPDTHVSILMAVASFIIMMLAALALTIMVYWLAPRFGGISDKLSAFKLVAYGTTAAWLASLFSFVPFLGFFNLLGLYSLYLYYAGARPIMQIPHGRILSFSAVVMACALLLSLMISPATVSVVGALNGGSIASADAGGTLNLPSGGKINVDVTEQFAKRMEDAAAGRTPAIAPVKLQDLLPASVGRRPRMEVVSGAIGQFGSFAEGKYGGNDNEITLKIADMAALGAVAGLGVSGTQNHEDATSYERTGIINGRMHTEEWHKAESRGRYAVVIGNRFVVQASGRVPAVEELKKAVELIDPDDLDDLLD